MKRLFDRDPLTGISKYWHVTDKGEYVVETVQDVTKIKDANKRAYNGTDGKFGDLPRVASIPLSVYYELKRKGIADDPVALKKWLNDGDNHVFRTRAGRL
jgi:hypothetical protein